MQAALKSGELRNVADTLGGFGIVDDMIKIWEQKHILANMEVICHPSKDKRHMYDWITITPGYTGQHSSVECEKNGYACVSIQSMQKDKWNTIQFHFYRRLKSHHTDADASEGAEDDYVAESSLERSRCVPRLFFGINEQARTV